MTLTKAGYEFSFDEASDVLVLGGDATAGHSDLSLVDFVVECDDRYIFVETAEGLTGEDARDAMKSDFLCCDLARKYRDSLFFYSFGGRPAKSVEYAVFYANGEVDGVLLSALQDELRRRIPTSHPLWRSDSAEACFVMNVHRWKKRYGDDSIRQLGDVIAES